MKKILIVSPSTLT